MTAIDQDSAPPLPTFSTPAEAHPAGGNGLQGLYSNVFGAERDLAYPDPSVRWCPGANR